MSTEEQQFEEDSQMGGPGAPTPVSALEVHTPNPHARTFANDSKGRKRFDCA